MTQAVAIELRQAERISTANCAGQFCPERGECRRFRMLIPKSGQKRDFAHRDTLGVWMSFDLERKALGDCPAFIRQREPR